MPRVAYTQVDPFEKNVEFDIFIHRVCHGPDSMQKFGYISYQASRRHAFINEMYEHSLIFYDTHKKKYFLVLIIFFLK